MSGDHLERLETAYTTRRAKVAGTRPDVVEVFSADLRAALDELTQLRAQQRPALGNVYAAGQTDAIAAIRTPGWAERQDAYRRGWDDCAASVRAALDTTQRPAMEGEPPC